MAVSSEQYSGLRKQVYERDDYTCQGPCGRVLGPGHRELTLDHRMPRSRGGKHELENLDTMCRPCNTGKANRLPGETFEPAAPKAKKPPPPKPPRKTVALEDLHPRVRALLSS